jgi:hypothetical protein
MRRAIILYRDLVMHFRDCIEDKGLTVKPIYVHRYWENPLDMLRILSLAQVMGHCIRPYLGYLDYVFASEDMDAAHAKWTSETQAHVPQNALYLNSIS